MPVKISQRFEAALKQIFLNQSREIRAYMTTDFVLSGKRVSLRKWVNDDVIKSLLPFVLRDWQSGLKEGAEGTKKQGVSVNTRALRQEIEDEAYEQIRRLLLENAKATAAAINKAVTKARRALKAGKPGALIVVTKEIEKQLLNKNRAKAIVATETETAHNGGRLMVITESGAKGKVWVTNLSSNNLCEVCAKLNGKIVKPNEPFWVNPKGGPYAVINQPPLHPNCRCRMKASFRRSR